MKYQKVKESDDFSPQRRLLYYSGMVLSGIGLFLILSIFVTAAMSIRAAERPSFAMFMLRGVGGMVLMIVGGIVRGIGERGQDESVAARGPKAMREDLDPFIDTVTRRAQEPAARPGLELYPRKTWEDAKPFTDAIGRNVQQFDVEEYRADSMEKREAADVQVMVRCRYCRALSPEDANFCDQCGAKL